MKKQLGFIVLASLMSACSSSTKVSQAIEKNGLAPQHYSHIEIKNNGTEAPEHFEQALKSYLKQVLNNNNLLKTESGNAININIMDYRMRSGFTRAMFGLLAGKDGIDSEVIVTDENGNVIGKSTVSSYNVMAVGDMQDIARMHAEEIAKFLSNKN